MLVVVQTVHVWVVPHLAATQRRVSVTLQSDAVYLVLRQQVTLGGTSLDEHFREVLVEEYLFQLGCWVECYLDDFCLAIGVGSEVDYARAFRARRQVVFAVAGDGWHVEALDIVVTLATIAVDGIVDGALVVLLEDVQPDDVFAHEQLVGDTDYLELTILIEDDDVIDVRTVADKLVLLQTRTDEAVLAVDVQFLVGLDDLGGLDGVEVANLRQSRMVLAVLVFQELEPLGRHLYEVGQVAVYLINLCLDAGHQLVSLVLVEFQDALHLDFQQLQDVVLGDLTHHLRIERCQSFVDMFADAVNVGCLLELLILIDAFLDEYLL